MIVGVVVVNVSCVDVVAMSAQVPGPQRRASVLTASGARRWRATAGESTYEIRDSMSMLEYEE